MRSNTAESEKPISLLEFEDLQELSAGRPVQKNDSVPPVESDESYEASKAILDRRRDAQDSTRRIG